MKKNFGKKGERKKQTRNGFRRAQALSERRRIHRGKCEKRVNPVVKGPELVGAEFVVSLDGCREGVEHVRSDTDVAHGDAARDLGNLVLCPHHRPDAVHGVVQKQLLAVCVAGQRCVKHIAQTTQTLL